MLLVDFFDVSENGEEMTSERCIPSYALTRGALPIVRDNYRINKFTSWRNAYNISTSAKWYRDTVVYHQGSYSPRPVTHCRAYVVSRYPFGSYPPRCSMARIVRHARSTPLKNHACLFERFHEMHGGRTKDGQVRLSKLSRSSDVPTSIASTKLAVR